MFLIGCINFKNTFKGTGLDASGKQVSKQWYIVALITTIANFLNKLKIAMIFVINLKNVFHTIFAYQPMQYTPADKTQLFNSSSALMAML